MSVAAMKVDRAHIAHFALIIGGAPAPRKVMEDLLDCTVENSIHLPDVCAIRLHDAEFHWLDSDTFREGAAIEVRAAEEKDALVPLFYGEVTSLEMDLAAHGVPTILVRGMDRSHRLHRGRFQRSFVQMSDNDIVSKIGMQAGFTVHAEGGSQVHDWVFQNNQTNWEFLCERAARCGSRLYVKKERDLHFKKIDDSAGEPVRVEWGINLRSFRPRLSAGPQVGEVTVRGWDSKRKVAIVGKSARLRGMPRARAAQSQEKAVGSFGAAPKMVVVDRPVQTQAEADSLAQSLFDEIGGGYLEADGLCFGMPTLRPGVEIEIPNIGKRFSGKYFVTATTHVYSPAEGYATMFSVSGKRPATLLSLIGEGAGSVGGQGLGERRNPVGGNIVVGIVTDNKDPEGLGRVRVKYPWLSEEHTSDWARQVSQMAGKGRGMFNIPEINDEVLVAFEHGDIHRPYVLGQLWNTKDRPPAPKGDGMHGPGSEVNRRGFYSRIGHQIDFNDTGGKGDITLTTAGGHVVTLNDAGKKIEITTTGKHTLVLDDAGNKIMAKTNGGHLLTLTDPGAMITVKDIAGDTLTMGNGMINVTALQMMTLAAPVVNIAGALAVNIAGLITNVAAGTLATVSGGVGVKITGGASVDISSEGVISEKAKAINMNS